MTSKEIALAICRAADDKKARDIVWMDMREVMLSTDYFVICSAGTATQARAIADNVEEALLAAGIACGHMEGYQEGEWILLDYGDAVLHIFREEAREYYALERLWGDAVIASYEE